MSAELAFVNLPEREAPAEAPGRRLRVVDRPARRRRPTLASALIAVLFAGLVAAAQMTLSIATTQDSFVLAGLRAEQRELTLQTQSVQAQLTGLSSPQYLAANADALGMVVAGTPGYLRLSDATILGPGASATGKSTVRPNSRTNVSNALVADTPLITNPRATIQGAVPVAGAGPTVVEEPVIDLPPAITDGLPSPNTH